MAAETRENHRPPRDNLIRALGTGLEIREAEEDGMPTLYGHFVRWNDWAEIDSIFEGNFMERFLPGAFKKTFREQRDEIQALFQHGFDPVVGDKPLGPIETLREDDTGAFYEVPLLDTAYNREIVPGLEAGVYGASFKFRAIREEFNEEPKKSDHNPDGIPERSVKEAEVFEFSPVTFPAYANATAGVRSLTDQFIFEQFQRNPERVRELLEALPTRHEEPEAEQETENGAGAEPHPVRTTTISDRLWRLGRKEEAWKLP